MKEPSPHSRLDLLVIDIDDTFIYHRTIAIANSILLSFFLPLFQEKLDAKGYFTTGKTARKIFATLFTKFHKFRWKGVAIRKLLYLLRQGALLHALNVSRKIANTFHIPVTNRRLLTIWADTLVRLEVDGDLLRLEDSVVTMNLRPRVLGLYTSLKRINPDMRVLALSEHFSVGKDPIHKVLGADSIITNRFKVSRKGTVTGFDMVISSPDDKLRLAQEYANTIGAKDIGLIIEDWDDRSLLKLEGVRYALFRPRLKRFIPEGVEGIPF